LLDLTRFAACVDRLRERQTFREGLALLPGFEPQVTSAID
jgi:hypothetical protein